MKETMLQGNQIEIKKVSSKKDMDAFFGFYCDLYKDNEYAVPFIRFDEENTLSKERNSSFEFCEAEYYLALRGGKVVGRVAAIINHRANEEWQKKQVRFGWFDFIDDPDVSRALLETVEQYGREHGMTEMVGPLGFTDMDREGMLIEGFDRLATAYVIYNYPYYPQHIEALGGFEKDNDWMEYRIKVPEVTPEKFAKTAQMIERRYNLHPYRFSRSQLVKKGMGHRIFEILNETYANLYDFQQLSEKQINQLIDQYIKMADLDLVVGVVDRSVTAADDEQGVSQEEIDELGGKLVGFGVSFPSFARALQKTRNGKLLPWGWWHLLKVLKWHKTDTVDLLLIGVLPAYRVKGANDCGHDAKQYIDDVVMTRVDCCPPNAHTDDGEGCSGKPMLVTLGCIEGGDQHIGCMQTWYGSKDIGIVTIDGVEDRIAHQLVKACQTCHIARCSQDGGEPILHHIPGW